MVVQVADVADQEFAERFLANLIVHAPAVEGGVGQAAEDGGEELAAHVENGNRVLGRLLIIRERLDEQRLVVADQHRPILGDHALHAVDADQVAVHQVNDDLLDRPGAGHRASEQILARQPANGVPQRLAAALVFVDRISVACHGYHISLPMAARLAWMNLRWWSRCLLAKAIRSSSVCLPRSLCVPLRANASFGSFASTRPSWRRDASTSSTASSADCPS